jgi:hypothetical protein
MAKAMLASEKSEVDRDPQERLQSLMEGIAETILDASDEEILAESQEQGRDPFAEAEEVRRVLLDALKVGAGRGQHAVRQAGAM